MPLASPVTTALVAGAVTVAVGPAVVPAKDRTTNEVAGAPPVPAGVNPVAPVP